MSQAPDLHSPFPSPAPGDAAPSVATPSGAPTSGGCPVHAAGAATSGDALTPPPSAVGPAKTGPFESGPRFLAEGYAYISGRCDELGTDVFTSRLGLVPVTFLRGAEAAGLFYTGELFDRTAAVPPTVMHLLQDKGSMQTLEDDAHRHRKRAFLSLMGPEAMRHLGDLYEEEWHRAMERLRRTGRGTAGLPVTFTLHDEVVRILTATVCRWAGIPDERVDVKRRADELGMMVSRVASVGPRNAYAQWRRRGTERWATGLVEAVRAGELRPAEGTALEVLAHHRDTEGELLTPEVAGVELINVLRATVAVSRFIAFAAVALEQHPQWRERFAAGDEADLVPFVHEVRRFFPFFPAVPGRARRAFSWNGHAFHEGELVMLDLYGTNHDRRTWGDPEAFRPERFRGFRFEEHPTVLIPQGAGDHEDSHRCPGEWSTVELMTRAVRLLATSGLWLPAQDLTIPLNRLPALPRSGVKMAFETPTV